MRLDLEPALDEDEFEVLPFGCDCEPAGLSWLLVVRSFLEAEGFSVELECLILVTYDYGCMSQFLNHKLSYS